jgi:hypothetical protein
MGKKTNEKLNDWLDMEYVYSGGFDAWFGGARNWVTSRESTGIAYYNVDLAYAYRNKWGPR